MKQLMTLILMLAVSLTALTQGLSVGDEAPNFTLKNVDGEMVSLSDYNDNEGVIVVFTCNHCPFSKMYEDRLIALNTQYEGQGYPVVAINPNDPEVQPQDSYDLMQVRAEEKEFNFPYLFDENQEVYPQYGATRTPHIYLLKKDDGKFIVKYIGAIDDNARNQSEVSQTYLSDAIDNLKRDQPVDPSFTKAVGCTIKKKA